MLKLLKQISRWYFSKSAMPYWMVLLFDCFVVLFTNLVVFALDNGATYTAMHFWPLVGTLLVYLIPFVVGFRLMRTYSGVMRYSSFTDLYRLGIANFIGIATVETLRLFLNSDSIFVPIRWRTLVFAWLLSTVLMFSARLVIKYLFDLVNEERALRRVFIYGTKSGGQALAKSIRVEQPQRFVLKGFISDSTDMPGHTLLGQPVFKNDDRIIDIMKERHVKVLLVSPMKAERLMANAKMNEMLLKAGIQIYTVQLGQRWDGKGDINPSQIHEIQIEDLLPRDEIEIDLQAVEKLLRGKRIMITGSAGSIGSELVRQIAKWEPSQLVLVDQAETPQHDIRLLMNKDFPGIRCEAVVTSITNSQSLERLFAQYRPEYVFHAAAYKHVPMMEDNPTEAVQNNIQGTRILADLAVKYGVKKFVMISTDKAVNPTNVMGCSKRICEIYVQALDSAIKSGKVNGQTQFVTTRFGNVLGSNGSVIPLFRKQILEGGPVTVTHPDIIRFFMLIPEACKLVLEAGTMGNGGEIFVFDMGKPVKIADLARRMILLSGAKNVDIKFTGLRDGEKLYEEVLNDEEQTMPTFNKKIKIAKVREYDYDDVVKQLDELASVSEKYDNMETVRHMKSIVPEYKSQNSVYESLD